MSDSRSSKQALSKDMKGVEDVKTSRRLAVSTTVAIGATLAACVFTSLAFFTSLQLFAGAQQSQAPVFKSKIDLVHLDVSVLDKNRRPVRGLGKADFTVFEDGKPQEIAIFEPIDVPDPEPPPVAWMR